MQHARGIARVLYHVLQEGVNHVLALVWDILEEQHLVALLHFVETQFESARGHARTHTHTTMIVSSER